MSKDMLGATTLEALRRSKNGLLRDLGQKLAGSNKDEYLRILKRSLRKESPWIKAEDFPIWRSLSLGRSNQLSKRMPQRFRIGENEPGTLATANLLEAIRTTSYDDSTQVDLVRVSFRQLGLDHLSSYDDFLLRVPQCGLELCPQGLALALRKNYNDQPVGEWIYVAMKPIAYKPQYGLKELPYIFVVANMEGDLLLTAHYADASNNEMVLVKPRRATS